MGLFKKIFVSKPAASQNYTPTKPEVQKISTPPPSLPASPPSNPEPGQAAPPFSLPRDGYTTTPQRWLTSGTLASGAFASSFVPAKGRAVF